MQSEETGVRVWNVANVGTGQLITWGEIKKHHHGANVVNPCVPLIHVPAAIDPARVESAENCGKAIPSQEFVGKIHRSHRNVKTRNRERALRRESKKVAREHNYREQVKHLADRVEEVKNFMCKWCSRHLNSADALHRHQRDVCVRARGHQKKTLSESVTANLSQSTICIEARFEPEETVTVTDSMLTMGYAWKALRTQVTETVGKRARLLLEQAFQRGVAKGGDRQSCFQMVDITCCSILTTPLILYFYNRLYTCTW